MYETSVAEKNDTRILYLIAFSLSLAVLDINKQKTARIFPILGVFYLRSN